jgi:hypothetical protein
MLMILAMCCSPALAQSASGGGTSGVSNAAPGGVTSYDSRLTFAPLTLPGPANAYRSSNGAPGPEYWQNEADYELHATLDTEHKQLRATETITYTNNSPDVLPSVWVQLEQNIYREDSRAHIVSAGSPRPRRRRDAAATDTNAAPEKTTTDGFVFDSVEVERGRQTVKADYLVNDTRMQIRLPEPLK